MTRRFVQTKPFLSAWEFMRLDDTALSALENTLLATPEAGDMVEGAGGARKLRIPLYGRGKSGGARVIYFDVGDVIFLLTAYPKNVREDLTQAQKKQLKELTHAIRKEQAHG